MTILGKGVGVLAKGIGSGSPSYVLQDQPDDPIIHPFRVTAKLEIGDNIIIKIRAGTVNNLVPYIGDEQLDSPLVENLAVGSAGTWDVFIRAESASPPIFTPDTLDCIVNKREDGDLTDTNTYGYLRIATVVVTGTAGNLRISSVNQYVYASQVLVRAKPGTATALWFWSSR